MAIGDRLLRARQRRAARMQGFETALGLADEPPPMRTGPTADLRCARCGGGSELESLDLRTARGRARCRSCGQGWSILYGA